MPSLLESVTSLLEEGDTYDKLGRLIGSDADKARSASAVAAPAVLERLADEAADERRASDLLKLMERDNPAGVDIGRYLSTRAPDVGNRMLDDLVNGDRNEWSSAAASAVDISGSQMDKLLATLTPITMAVLAKRRTDDKLDGAGVAKLLAAERAGLSGGGSAAATSGASAPAGPAGLGPKSEDERTALGWIGWAIGAVVLVLLLAWLLSTCNDETAELQGQNNTTVTPAIVTGTADNGGAGEDGVGDGDRSGTTVVDSAAGGTAESTADATVENTADNTAVAPGSDDELQADVDDALAGSGITGLVSGGEVQLTGTAADDQARSDAEASVEQLAGVTTVVNDIVVDGDAGETPIDSGTTINDLLDLDPVTFRVSSATITEAGRLVLDEAAAFMADNPDISIEVGGHTDSDGEEADNRILSQIRADSVKAYLVAAGIDADRMETRGYGETEPKVPNDSSEAKAQNRRIEFTVL